MTAKPDEDDILAGFFGRSLTALQAAVEDRNFPVLITAIARAIEQSLRAGGKLMIARNGGSATALFDARLDKETAEAKPGER